MHNIAARTLDHSASGEWPHLATLPTILRRRAEDLGEQTLYTYLLDGETQAVNLTYRELECRTLAIASMLQSLGRPGDRVLLLCPPGIEFITAFFGSICAGMIAVPAYPPHNAQTQARLEAIVEDSRANFVLATSSIIEKMKQRSSLNPMLSGLQHLSIDDIPAVAAAAWREPVLDSDSIALLQYTSGSTGKPKGAMISHGNLFDNVSLIRTSFVQAPKTCGVMWLPPYHDMGLVGGVIAPLYFASPIVLMSAFHFLQKPVRWLEAISRYRATISGGPNFAYDLCVSKIEPEQRKGLDLSCWDVAFNGAEPVRAETLDLFVAAFGPYGFQRRSFLLCYGLAEATLLVSARIKKAEPTILRTGAQALPACRLLSDTCGKSNGRALVGCGGAISEQGFLIVDPEMRTKRNPGEIGEVWVAGPSVAKGYWDHPEETRESFGATLADTGEGPFLRTGDLGFIYNNELFVTGRIKDLIIIRGRNHYPQDIELTVEKSYPALQSGCGAVFSIDSGGLERLVVVHEVKRRYRRNLNAEEVFSAIREAVSEQHELQIHAMVLIKTFSIPKTPSGKIQRHECRSAFLGGTLQVIAQNIGLPETVQEELPVEEHFTGWWEKLKNEPPECLLLRLESYLQQKVARIVRVSPGSIDPQKPLSALGIDSLMAVELKLSIETDTGAAIPIEAVFQGASISDMAAHVLCQLTGKGNDAAVGPLSCLLSRCSANKKTAIEAHTPEIQPGQIQPEHFLCEEFPELRNLQKVLESVKTYAGANPYFRVYDGTNRETARIDGRDFISFSSYNYLGLSGHPSVTRAAKEAIDQCGTSVSASRLISGERPLHRELEAELAKLLGVEECLAYVSGHATNVTTVGHLFGKADLIVYDALVHNSMLQGCALSGASHLAFPHNDWQSLDSMLHECRSRYRRVLIAIEGMYSMDGDVPDLPAFISVKKRHKALLMVDEAHSIGVLGECGRGIGEHFSVSPTDVDLWMGTLSKSFASCGGYIAGCKALIEYLKYTSPGFVYSVGMTPANTAAALAAIRVLRKEPQRVTQLRGMAKALWDMARERGIDTGTSIGLPIIPVIVGESLRAIKLSQALFNEGIDVLPMVYPAVPDSAARLRFFVSCRHTLEQISYTMDTVAKKLDLARRTI